MMELMEPKNTKDEWKLPKNVRQIGEPGQGTRVLIEDYVYTYLHQLAKSNLTCIKTAVLLGRIEDGTRFYVQGALEIDMGQEMQDWFSHEHWRSIFQEIENWFEGLEVVGWFMANPGFPTVLTDELSGLHNRNFSGSQYIFCQKDVLENEEVFYGRRGTELVPLCGFYIYYEKNDRMQAYMSQRRGGVGIEPEGILKDRATTRFRNVMQEKKEQNSQKKALAFLYTSCTFLVMVILVIGVTMVNNYDRMENMESAIHQISESLGDPEKMEEAVEEENRIALAESGQEPVQEEPKEEVRNDPPVDGTALGDEAGVQPEAPSEALAAAEETVPEAEVQEAASTAVKKPEPYEVQMGDTLLGICRARYGRDDMVEEICEINELDNSDRIYEGEIILLP